MKAKVYIGAIKYAVYIGRKIVEKTMNFFGFPARFFATKDGNLKDYKMYGNTVQGDLPDGYVQLESLSSTGYEYINTGLVIQSGDEIQLDYEWLGDVPASLSGDMMFFGCQNIDTTIGGVWVELYRRSSGTGRPWYARMGSTNSTNVESTTEQLTGRHLLSLNQTRLALDGTTLVDLDTTNTFQTTPLTLFGRFNQTGTVLNSARIKVYGLKVINNGVVRLNLIPCKNADNILGMYDTVTEQFLANSGTGALIAGSAVQPTPTEPLMIESVGDKTVNLFNKETITKGKYISQGGAVTSNASFCYGDYISVVPNRDYIISGNNKGGTAYRRIHGYGADQKWIRQIQALQVTSGADYTMTFTVPEGCAYIRFSGMSSTNDYEETNIVQIQEGSVVTEYESYGYKIPVNVANKNMLNPNAEVYNGYIGLMNVGEAIRYGSSTASKTYKKFAYFKPGTYTYSYNGSASTGSLRFVLCDENEIVREIVSTPVVQGRNEVTVNFTKEGWGYVSALVVATDIQIEEGDTATAYEPYFNQTTNIYLDEPLRKLGDYTDYIDFDNQKVVRQLKGELLTGADSETYTKSTSTAADIFSYTSNTEYRIPESIIMSSRFVNVQNIGIGNIYIAKSNNVALCWRAYSSSTVSTFKTWLASNNVEIVYPLATPTEESITLPAIALQQGNLSMDIETKIKPSQLTITGDIDDVR